jgi:hypothetical protein
MKTRTILCVSAVLLFAAILTVASIEKQGTSQTPKVNIGEFVKEIMNMKMEGGRAELAMWFPYEFYVESSIAEGGKTREAAEKEMDFIKPYHTIIVLCSIDQPDGSSQYLSEKEAMSRAVLKLRDGKEIQPLDKVPPLVSAAVSAMKAIISSEGDARSANMYILVFPAQTKQGQLIVDTNKKDKLTLVLKDYGKFKETVFVWRTPFDATTSIPPCEKCGEAVSAKWLFCPWCGAKLR